MATGIVKWFDAKKGFGFVQSGEIDYFAHFKSIQSDDNFKALMEGQKVEFTPATGPKGQIAEKIRVVG